MNKIKVVNDSIDKVNINKSINVEYYEKESIFGINDIRIIIDKSNDLTIELIIKDETKINFNIEVLNDVDLNINIITKGNSGKIKYTYTLYKNSNVNVFKFQNVDSIKELININLKEENSSINYNFKTIGNNKETYDYNICHDAKGTVSNIRNNGVCINNGLIIYQVSSYVPKNITGCVVNQSNRIINLTNNKCEIRPNLYIDTSDVSASHSALIGKFSDEEIFYLESRGIDYNSAINLLIHGFLTSNINNKLILNEINKNIKKYWR